MFTVYSVREAMADQNFPYLENFAGQRGNQVNNYHSQHSGTKASHSVTGFCVCQAPFRAFLLTQKFIRFIMRAVW